MKLKRCKLLLIFWMIAWIIGTADAAFADLEIHFLDVGQADAAVILCDGEVMIIDGGNRNDSDFIFSYLRNTLSVDRIDVMIASHPHEDHIGGLAAALNACDVGMIYATDASCDTKVFRSLVKYADEQGLSFIVPNVGDTFSVGTACVEFLSPLEHYSSLNDMSLVVRIVYGSTSFLFTGDAEWDAEHDMVESGADLSATLLKVGHHGSDTSSSYVFLREVMPKYAVISVGENNRYDHPSENVLSRLHDARTTVYRTDKDGTIICSSDGENLFFTTEKQAR